MARIMDSDGGSHEANVDADYRRSAEACELLERTPGEFRGKYVGIVRGQVVAADVDFDVAIQRLRGVEPDRRKHFVVLAGAAQPSVIHNLAVA